MDAGVTDLQAELDSVDAELELVELQISELLDKQAQLTSRKSALLLRLENGCDAGGQSSSKSPGPEPAMSKKELQRYDGTDFPWSKDVEEHLKNSFHLSKFRALQLRAINLTMAGKDVFLVMPTGRGKSLCFQLPAVCSNGFTLVITPLVSLMEDQIMYLKSIDVSAVMLNASSSKEHAKLVMAGMTDLNSPFKLLYVTPEKIAKSKLLMSRLEKAYKAKLLSRIAVDEVHCCSQWGHDFRPDYKLLGILKRQFPSVPLFGLTATATCSVLKDCEKILCVQQPVTITASFNRTNLYYEVRMKDSDDALMNDIASLIKGKYKDQSGIVYVFSQKEAETVSSELKKRDISAYPYHSNMDPEDKSQVHRKWTSNKIQVVVATVAFGMGIDKPDVRFVIHHTISKSIENYYQESGRAGRDDLPADCIVYFGFADIFRISTMVVMENVGHQKLLQMVAYCHNVDRCRRSLMAVHFDEVWDNEGCNQMCDTCRSAKDYASVDITQHARQVVLIVEQAGSMDEKVTPLKLVETWLGRGPAKLRKMIQTTTALSRRQAEAVIVSLLLQGYLREDYSFTPYATYFYMKLGRKAPLLKKDTHTITMNMWTAGDGPSASTPAVEVGEEVVCMSLDPAVIKSRCPPKKLTKEQRKQDLKPGRPPEGAQNQPAQGQGEEDKDERPFMSQHVVNVDVEINTVHNVDVSEGPKLNPIKCVSKQTSTSSWRARRKHCGNIRAAGRNLPSDSPVLTVSSSPSQGSVISATAAEELCDLRNYYSKQLKRINYISHEHLGPPPETGVLSCIREPLRSLRLPQRVTIAQTARSLWTRLLLLCVY
uniref:ATP-dependent DNA helicase n=1 Tax=Fundulus heteroclitus TaxID=8078 RepID=A0A3Q2QPM7_FUNHE